MGGKIMNKKRKLFLTIFVVVVIFTVNLFTNKIFDGFSNRYLAEFLVRFKGAVMALLGAFILKQLWIYYRADAALLKKGWTAGILDLLVTLYLLIVFLANKPSITAGPLDILFLVFELICVGIHEETLFRGLIQNAFHDFFGADKRGHVILATICAGLFFGAAHLTNALKPGVSIGDAAIQAVSVCGSGIFFGAVYFRTGKNLWYNVLIHGLHDAAIFLVQGALSGADSSVIISQASQNNNIVTGIGQTVLYAAVGLFLLRKKKVDPLLK